MKSVKKVVSLLMVLILMISLSGCIRIVHKTTAEDDEKIVEAKADVDDSKDKDDDSKDKEDDSKDKEDDSKDKEDGSKDKEDDSQDKGDDSKDKNDDNQDKDDEKKQVSSSNGSMTDDLYDFQFEIDGELFKLPMSYDEFVSHGYTPVNDENSEIKSHTYLISERFTKDDYTLSVKITNFGINAEPMKNCHITGVTFDDYYLKDTDIVVTFAKGIQLNKSTIDDVRAAYGEETSKYEGDNNYKKLTYKLDYNQEVEFLSTEVSGVIEEIEIENMIEPSDMLEQTVSDNVPDVVKQYKAPNSLDDDVYGYKVKFDGDMYQIPMPVSELEKNGWKISDDYKGETATGGRYYGHIDMEKGKKSISVPVKNYSEDATTLNNCFVIRLEADADDVDLEFEAAKGIKLGMSEADLLAILEGVDYDYEKGGYGTAYDIKDYDFKSDGISVRVDNETGKVYFLSVEYGPRVSDLYKR